MNKITLIGPFPDPVTGMTLLNKVFYTELKSRKIDVEYFDTILKREIKCKERQGKFEFGYFYLALLGIFDLLLFIIRRRGGVYYFTPAQSVVGYIRFIPAFAFSKIFGKRTVVHFHGSNFESNFKKTNFFYKFLIKISFKFIDRFVLLGESIKHTHEELLGKDKVYVCKNGAKPPSSVSKPQQASQKKNVLFLSNLMKDKGVFDILNAIKILDSDKFDFHFAGIIEPSVYDSVVSQLNSLGDRVQYHGAVYGDEKEYLLNQAHVFVLPSYDEGQPLSIIEAYSYGCSVLTTDVGGISDIFEHGCNGKLIPLADPVALAKTLLSITDSEYDLFKRNNLLAFDAQYKDSHFVKRLASILLNDM